MLVVCLVHRTFVHFLPEKVGQSLSCRISLSETSFGPVRVILQALFEKLDVMCHWNLRTLGS